MEKTKSGFPLKIRSVDHLLFLLWRRKADIQFIDVHLNSEEGTGTLHECMWLAEKAGLITIVHVPVVDAISNDTLFRLRLTPAGSDKVQTRVNMIVGTSLTIITIILSAVAAFR